MNFNRNLSIFAILLIVVCLIFVSQVSAVDFNGTSISDLDESIKTSDDGNIVLTNDLNFAKNGTIEITSPTVIDGNGHSMVMAPSQMSTLFDVKSDLTLKNLKLSGGALESSINENHCFIRVNSGSKLILDNVTVQDISTGNYFKNSFISNFGDITVEKSTFKNLNGVGLVFYSTLDSKSVFNNSHYEDSVLTFASDMGHYVIHNSFFSNIRPNNVMFELYGGSLDLKNCLFILNNKKLINWGMETQDKSVFSNNVFLGYNKSYDDAVFGDIDTKFKLNFTSNYLGTNTPFEDSLNVQLYDDEVIKLDITLPEDCDINHLEIGKKIPVEFKLSDGAESLPTFTVNITATSNMLLSQDSITFSNGNPVTVYVTPRESGNGSIILGYDLTKAISPSFDYCVYGELKNYSLIINSKDSIAHSDDLNVSFELKDDASNPISGSISLYIDGKYYDNVSISNGLGSIILSKLNVPSAVLSAFFYHQMDNYNDVNVSKSINVGKSNLNFIYEDVYIYEGQVATINVSNVPDDLKSSVIITLNGLGGQASVNNGVAIQSFSDLAVGDYTVSIFALGDSNYNKFDDVAMIYVSKKNVNPSDPDNPGNGSGSDTPGNGSGDNPDGPDVPDTPDNPGNGSSSGGNSPDVPDTPDTPDNPGSGSGSGDNNPSNPDAPDAPDVPDSPDVPDVPDGSDAPDVPDSNNPNTPSQNPQDGHNSDNSNSKNSESEDSSNQATPSVSGNNINSNPSNSYSSDTITTSNNIADSTEGSQSSNGQSQDANGKTGDSGESASVSKSYDINQVIDEVIHNKITYPVAVGLIIAVLILLLIGYRRKEDEEEY